MNLPDQIQGKCPECGAAHRFYRFELATEVYRRTCRRCRVRWQIVVKPVRSAPTRAIHVIDWVRLGSAR